MGGYSACSVSRCFRSSGAAPVPGMHGEKRRQCHDFPFSLYEVLRYMLPGAAGETEKQMAAVLPGDGKIRRDWTFLSGDFRARCAVIPPTAFLQTGPWS